jgi:hypothetical protein
MNLGKYIFGVREELFSKVETKEKERQFRVYNNLTLMYFILVGFTVISGLVFGIMIFNNIFLAIGIGVFLGAICFILLLLVFFLNMTTNYQGLYLTMTNMEPIFEPFYDKDMRGLTDEEALLMVEGEKQKLRETNQHATFDHFHLSSVVTSTVKVLLILIISAMVANAMEFVFFRSSLNESLHKIKTDPTLIACANAKGTDSNDELNRKIILAKWTLDMLKPNPGESFLFIDSRSFLLSYQVLDMSLGPWKVLLDIAFALLFLTPFILLRKSNEYAGGIFLKEAALIDIAHSYMFFLLSERERQKIKMEIETNYDYTALINKPRNEA